MIKHNTKGEIHTQEKGQFHKFLSNEFLQLFNLH